MKLAVIQNTLHRLGGIQRKPRLFIEEPLERLRKVVSGEGAGKMSNRCTFRIKGGVGQILGDGN